ncbi:DUF4097 family beta strand repeat-containing protein [Nocardia transvalensis]|uniref:DUF4097 family beta strand repeat-containing protein n=1 Tax=Nocardia transvalensis TaxID=37333 RepID=UPI0018954493|nr:DUF4097 family beta strand repeat-containing protein [Nocardia transvalensis]MBF6332811.1 DUF4097 family beta strand repeat protein [Nocardia transvalensis]
MHAFDTPGPIGVTVAVSGAEVRLAASDRADTVVRIEPVNKANGTDVKVAEQTRVDFSAGRLSVHTPSVGSVNGGSSAIITIELPTDSGLVAKLAHAQVRSDGPLGSCEVHMESGLVRLDRIGTLEAHISDGDLEVGQITGPADIDGAAGSVRIGEVAGIVRFRSSEGGIWIGDASDDLDLATAQGGIELGRADGNVIAKTVNGAIRVGRLTRGQAGLMNSAGNIEIGVSEGTAAWVDANSTKGSVHSTLAPQENPDEFDNTVEINARTRTGDILIRRAVDDSAPTDN